ncbi:MAG TPA: CsgG/HfaB family protein [Spirochaetia bacterium]|nr:CsgG/HfaB family protein [Spirochaetales bacterium]HRY71930.1 CsgG/HfaB family protein [Spirochaetia bacterium]
MKGKFLASAALALLVLSSCAGGPEEAGEGQAEGSPGGDLVAVFDFELKGGGPEYESLRTDAPEAVAEALLRGGVLRPVERRQLEKALAEQALSLSGVVDEATAARAGRVAGARFVLLGSVSFVAGQARVSCRVIDAETAELVYAQSAYGDAEYIFDLVDELAGMVEDEFSE